MAEVTPETVAESPDAKTFLDQFPDAQDAQDAKPAEPVTPAAVAPAQPETDPAPAPAATASEPTQVPQDVQPTEAEPTPAPAAEPIPTPADAQPQAATPAAPHDVHKGLQKVQRRLSTVLRELREARQAPASQQREQVVDAKAKELQELQAEADRIAKEEFPDPIEAARVNARTASTLLKQEQERREREKKQTAYEQAMTELDRKHPILGGKARQAWESSVAKAQEMGCVDEASIVNVANKFFADTVQAAIKAKPKPTLATTPAKTPPAPVVQPASKPAPTNVFKKEMTMEEWADKTIFAQG